MIVRDLARTDPVGVDAAFANWSCKPTITQDSPLLPQCNVLGAPSLCFPNQFDLRATCMKSSSNRFFSSAIVAVVALSSSASAADRFKQNNLTALNLAGSWDTLPTSLDVAVWNNTVAGANATALGADLSWAGIKIVNPGGLVTIGTAATNTLTLGSSGIDMSGATQNLLINSNLTAGSAQTWQVAAGRTLQIQSINTNTRLSGSGDISLTNSTGTGTATFDFRPGSSGSTGFSDQAGFYSYTGNWTINSGVVVKTLRNGRNAWGSGTINLNGGTIGQQQNFSGTWTNNISLQASSNSTIDDYNTSGTRTLKLQGVISGSGNLTIAETNAGVSYAVNGGVVMTGANTLSGQVTVGPNAVLRIGGVAGDSASLDAGTSGGLGTATVVNNGTLTLSRSDVWTFANQITSGSGAVTIGGVTGTLVANGSGQVVTMSGTNSYTGATTVGQGRLNLTGSLTSNITVQAAGRISGTGSTTGTLSTVTGSGIVLAGGSTFSSIAANGVAIGGTTTISFLSNPTAATTYDVFTYGAGGVTGAASLVASWRGSFVNDTLNQKYTFVTGASATRTWNTTSGTWDNTGINNNWAEGDLKFYDSDSAVFGSIAADSTVTLGTNIAPSNVTVQHAANTYTFQTGSITGTSTLAKTADGTLVLSAANTFSGATTISAGVIRIGNTLSLQNSSVTNNVSGGLAFGTGLTTATLGALAGSGDISLVNAGSGAVALTAGGNGASSSFTGALSGSGSLTKTGTGSLTLSASNSYSGGTTLSAGTLVTGNVSALGSGAINVTGGTLDLNADLTAASLAGSASTVDAGGFTLTLNAASNGGTFYTGNFTSTGSLILRGGSHTIQDNVTGGAGSGTGNFLLLQNIGGGSSFHLDTGSSSISRRDFGYYTDSSTTLTLNSLQGHGALRSDAGSPSGGVRNIVVNQSGDTTFDGAILSHTSGAGALRSLNLTKQGGGNLTLAGFIGEQTAASGIGSDVVNLTVEGGVLNLTNSANATAGNGTAGTMTTTGGTLAFATDALGKGGAGSVVMNGGTLRWNSGNTQDLTVSNRLTLVAGKNATFDTNGNNVTFSNALGGGAINASLVKTGTGSLTLEGNNTYTGNTLVSNGALVINGSVSTGNVTTQSGAMLMGSGTIGGATTIDSGATFSPGESPGLLTINDALTLNGTTLMEIGGQNLGTEYDSVSVSGLMTFGGILNIVPYNSYNLAQASSYTLFGLSGGGAGTFSTVNVGGLSLSGLSGVWTAQDGGFTYTFTESNGILAVVPEPGAALLGGIGMLILLRRRRVA